MFKSLLITVLIFFSAQAFAQKQSVSGRVFDSAVQRGLPYATLSLVKAKDSTLVTFSRADSSGSFRFNNVEDGSYLVSTSFVGYLPVWKPVTVAGSNVNMGTLNLTDVKFAQDVTVTAKRPPVTINNDTLEFNTENFKTQPNAVVEDMLKKMPGVTIDTDGTVRVNGQIVRRVTVNGKEFFTGDPKMATKNLNADAVDKVQVYDRKSDQSQFTGVDDGNTEKTINLKLKKDRNNALFGKVTAGGGTEGRYDGQANINQFKGDKQLSFLGMGNNTNRQGFSLNDILNFTGEMSRGMRNGGGITIRTGGGGDDNGLPVSGLGQNQQGIAKTFAAGGNYNNTWNNRKTDLNGSITTSDIDLNTVRETNRLNLLPGNNFEQFSKNISDRRTKQSRVNATWDQKIDSFTSFKMTPVLSYQESQSSSANTYTSKSTNGSMINEGFNNSYVKSNAINFTNNLLFRKRFAKKGRTISANLNMAYNHSESNGSLQSKNTDYTSGVGKDSLLNQQNERDAVTTGFGATLTYTEPIGKRSLVEVSGFYNSNKGESERTTYNYNGNSGKYDQLNTLLTNNFESNYTYQGGSANFRSNLNKFNLNFGASLQDAILKGVNRTFKNEQSQHFTDVLPNASIQYNIARTKNLRFEYRTNTTQPSIQQLQPVADVSDPLNIYRGNANLKRQYDQTFSLNFFSASIERRTNFFAFLNYTVSDNAIVNADSLKSNGVRVSYPVNVNGAKNFFGSFNYGFPIRALKSNISFGSNSSMFKNISFLNGAKNEITTWSLGPNVNWNYSLENKIELQLTARYNYTNVKYTLQPQLNNDYWQQTYTTDMTNFLPWGIVVNNQLNYVVNTGRADGFNTSIPLWNASVAKSFLKNKRAEVKMSAFDLLNRNVGITRSANQNYISDVRYNVLQRYFLMSFTYSLNKSGLGGGPRAVIRTF